jgi:peptide chain release factor 1
MLSTKILQDIISEYNTLTQKMEVTTSSSELITISKQHKKLQPRFELAQRILEINQAVNQNQELLETLSAEDTELKELLQQDNLEKTAEIRDLQEKILEYLVPIDPKDDNNVILEIRAGAGGDESALFASELFRMYSYLCQELGFKIKILSSSHNTLGGYKELICEIKGENVFSWFKYESGVHRVQRVPLTEKQGRIHTSTVSVAILPLIEDNDEFKLDMKEVEIITSTSQGAGGQSVNTTYSAIKVKHLPTKIEAQSQDERNQQQNKIKALQVLTSRVFDYYEQIRLEKETAQRREQVGRADRSEKIRTYNFPQDRITDHRYNLSYNQLPAILNGQILQILKDIKKEEAQKQIANLENN